MGVTAKDFCEQTWKQSHHSRRRSQRVGLRITATGCLFALLYAAYKVFGLISIGLELNLLPHGTRCSTPISPFRCVFSVTAPALAVLLITLGLTLPAVAWPFSQFLRRRWESRSFAALAPLWQDITDATPEVVLATTDSSHESDNVHRSPADDSDFHLHRRVIEINDGGLALRPHRSPHVREQAERTATARGLAGTPEGDALVEAAILRAAVHAKHTGGEPQRAPAPPAPGAASRAGDLRAETAWLLLVAHAYAQQEPAHPTTTNDLTRSRTGSDPRA
ncbi:MAB_1171c family putative transporter [Streptomyces sp. NPDC012510]|uniref:MAB_1171c family putative transporter n=1 Tax=Streptomyces sp. NPDC012510 TaxID=3364838 RepID=UPI0036E313C4